MRNLLFSLVLPASILFSVKGYAQMDLLEIDSSTQSFVKTAPFDKPFLIKAQIDAETITGVFMFKRVGKRSFDESLAYYSAKHPAGFTVPQLEQQYFWTRKIGDKSYLYISIADHHLFKPGESYFIVPDLRQTDPAILSFFDAFYRSTLPINDAAVELAKARENLSKYELGRRKIFGNQVDFGFMTLKTFDDRAIQFAIDFKTKLQPSYHRYELSKTIFEAGLSGRVNTLNANLPSFDSLTYFQLYTDSSINKEALNYLGGRDMMKNDLINDLSTIQVTGRIIHLLTGATALQCIYCDKVDISSSSIKDLSKRISNLDSSIKQLNILQRSLYLLTARQSTNSNISASINRINVWISQLQASKDSIALMNRQRKGIEDIVLDSVFVGKVFTYTQVISGNTYLNFETRNKLLLTPDFGVVFPAFSPERKNLEYRIIPYLGFHVNLKAVDKDIPFKSYRKHPLQRLSLMVGWSLVSLNQDSVYANFFEKSTFLTGAGFRINNVIRLTTGAQWLFKIKGSVDANPSRKLKAIPYVGLSFDLNIKQYLNGFADLLSGIGKTNPSTTTPSTEISQ